MAVIGTPIIPDGEAATTVFSTALNLYATPAQVRTAIGDTDTSRDAEYMRLLEAVSRAIDLYCHRHFFVITESRIFNRPNIAAHRIWITDLLVCDDVKTDPSVDQSFSNTVDTGDYLLYPQNDFPLVYLVPTAYSTWLDTIMVNSSAIKITGEWGYGNGQSATPYYPTAINGTIATTSGTALTLSAEGTIEAGHTILIETEQMYVQAVSSDGTKKATVRRGVNKTDAATHDAKTISVFEYPASVVDAAIKTTMRKAITDPQGGAQSIKVGAFSQTFGSGLDAKGQAVQEEFAILNPLVRMS